MMMMMLMIMMMILFSKPNKNMKYTKDTTNSTVHDIVMRRSLHKNIHRLIRIKKKYFKTKMKQRTIIYTYERNNTMSY